MTKGGKRGKQESSRREAGGRFSKNEPQIQVIFEWQKNCFTAVYSKNSFSRKFAMQRAYGTNNYLYNKQRKFLCLSLSHLEYFDLF
uniref:Uncharacterized protein n=1 Tax=Oryza punctata TaxID=4537 RepID=A0A0E0MKV0_ORYPU